MAVKISKKIYEGLEKVRESGETNMFDRNAVIQLLTSNGDFAAANWVQDHRKEYGMLIFEGPEIIGAK